MVTFNSWGLFKPAKCTFISLIRFSIYLFIIVNLLTWKIKSSITVKWLLKDPKYTAIFQMSIIINKIKLKKKKNVIHFRIYKPKSQQ